MWKAVLLIVAGLIYGCSKPSSDLAANSAGAKPQRFDPVDVLFNAEQRSKVRSWGVEGPKFVLTQEAQGMRIQCPPGTPLLLLKESDALLKKSKLIYGIGDMLDGNVRVWDFDGKRQPQLEATIQFALDNNGNKAVQDTDPPLSCFVILSRSNQVTPSPGYSLQVQAGRPRMFGLLPYMPNARLSFQTSDVARQAEHKSLDIPISITGSVSMEQKAGKLVMSIAGHALSVKEVRAYKPSDSAKSKPNSQSASGVTLRTTIVVSTSPTEAELVLNCFFGMVARSAVTSAVVLPDGKFELKTLNSPLKDASPGRFFDSEPLAYSAVGASSDGSEVYICTNLNQAETVAHLPSGHVYSSGLIRGVPLWPNDD